MTTDKADTIHCDYLIIGCGISGMAMAHLLAKTGASVCVLERGTHPGGSMRRFYRKGCPLDTGFHFTTGLSGAFGDMFRYLGMYQALEEVPVDKKIFLADRNRMFDLPRRQEEVIEYYAQQFPEYQEQIRHFLGQEKNIFETTALFSLDPSHQSLLTQINFTESDIIPLLQYVRTLGMPPELEVLLCSFAICCSGTPANEISLSTLCRINYGLNDNLVRFADGGDAVIECFMQAVEKYNIRLLTNTQIAECIPEAGNGRKECHKVITSTGKTITFDNCIFSTHPIDIFRTISPISNNVLFAERIREFEESCGFFTLWAKVKGGEERDINQPPKASLISYLRKTKLDTLMSPVEPDNTATGVMTVEEIDSTGKPCETLTVFENVFPEECAEWEATRIGQRGAAYQAYKQKRCGELLEKTYRVRPDLEGKLEFLDSASQLTYRDYLSPFGSAYGVRQKVNQFNIFGRLPIRNFYAIGQNALLPGVFGAMQSSFVLWRKLIGEQRYQQEISEYNKTKGFMK